MKKIVLIFMSLISFSTITEAKFIGAFAPDKKVGNISLSTGQAKINSQSTPIYSLDFGGNYYYKNGIMWGSIFSLGYTQNPDTTVDSKVMAELSGKFKFGYSFGELSRALSIYALADFSYLMYNTSSINYITGNQKDSFNSAQGIGSGIGAEYRFKNNYLVTTSYTSITMTPDQGENFEYEKILIGLGYSW
jgi:hypothetical protein